MNRTLLLILSLNLLALPGALLADQYAYVSRTVCSNALRYVPAGSVVISFCSQCDGEHVEVWKVKQAFIADVQYENRFQLTLFAERLYRSKQAYDEGKFREPVEFEKIPDGENSLTVEGVDLAYLYVRKPDGSFRDLAKEMNLDWLHCSVESIRLPAAIDQSLRD